MGNEFSSCNKAFRELPHLFEPHRTASERQDTTRPRPSFFDAVLVSREAPDWECLGGFVLAGILLLIIIESSFDFFGLELNGALLATAPFLCLPGFVFFRARRRRTERIVIENGVIRISQYVQNRLVDQRRMKLCDLTIELRETIARDCMQIVLRTGDRTRARSRNIKIAGRLAPAERTLFLEDFLEGLRRSSANPGIRRSRACKFVNRSIWRCLLIKTLCVATARRFPRARDQSRASDAIALHSAKMLCVVRPLGAERRPRRAIRVQ